MKTRRIMPKIENDLVIIKAAQNNLKTNILIIMCYEHLGSLQQL